MCIYSFFLHLFPNFICEKKLLHLLLFSQGLFVYVFSIPMPIFIKKKYPHPTFWLCAKKSDFVARVGQLVGFLVCLSVGWTFVGQFGWFFFVYCFHRQ